MTRDLILLVAELRGITEGIVYPTYSGVLLRPNRLPKYLKKMLGIRAEHFRFGPVLDQNKQPNWFFFLKFWNRTEPKTGSNRLISVRFGLGFFPSKPIQTEITPVEFFLGFLSTTFFNTSVLYLLSFSRKSTSIFVLIDPCPKVKPSKKIHKTKQKIYP
jgi:hypothetical protein